MNHINHRIYLDIHSMGPLVSVRCKLGDTARSISATLTDKCAPYRIPETCIAVFTAKKPDGTILYNDCAISGNTVIYPFTPQTACCPGTLDCEFRLYDGEDILLVSPCFHLIVEDTVYQDGDIVESASEVSALTGLMSDASEMMRDFQSLLENGAFTGPQGEKGEKGDKGNPGLVWKGQWSPGESYEIGDAVYDEDGTFICVNPATEIFNLSDTNYWNILVKKGENGRNGENGKTPVKGTDYFTEADKAEMVNKVIAALPIYNGEVI